MNNLDIPITNVFLSNMRARTRYIINEGGARSSKTYSIIQLLILKALSNTNKKLIFTIARKSLTTLRPTAMRDFFEILENWGLYKKSDYNKNLQTYSLNGNLFEFTGVDNAQKKRGAKRHYLFLNEMNEFTEEDFKQFDMRTINQVYGDYNPSMSKHWIYDFLDNNKNITLIQSTYKDNEYLEDSIKNVIENLKNINSNDYNIYALGQRGEASGYLFKSFKTKFYTDLPSDIRGVIYCDPNLAKKGQGDTTGLIKLYYSNHTQNYYVTDFICRSFSDTNELIDKVLAMKSDNCRIIGFDGNVSQESTWDMHVQNYARIKQIPAPIIQFKKYKVDELSKNAEVLYSSSRILFNPELRFTDDGKRAFAQIYGFQGKKNSKEKDDAPDALICGIELIYDNFSPSALMSGMSDTMKSIFKKR